MAERLSGGSSERGESFGPRPPSPWEGSSPGPLRRATPPLEAPPSGAWKTTCPDPHHPGPRPSWEPLGGVRIFLGVCCMDHKSTRKPLYNIPRPLKIWNDKTVLPFLPSPSPVPSPEECPLSSLDVGGRRPLTAAGGGIFVPF